MCVEENQRVLLANGSWKPIKDIEVGEYVAGYDNQKSVAKKVVNKILQGEDDLLEVVTRSTSLKTNANNRSDNIVITMLGSTKTLQEWCDDFGVDRAIVSARWRMLFKSSKRKNYPVLQYSMKGQLLAEYENVIAAAQQTKIGRSAIHKCLSGGNNSSGGYIWR